MVRVEAFDLVDKVDVVIPGVGKGGGVENWCYLRDRSLEGVWSDERVETEKARIAELVSTARDQCLARRPAQVVEWPAVEVENLSHESSGRMRQADQRGMPERVVVALLARPCATC